MIHLGSFFMIKFIWLAYHGVDNVYLTHVVPLEIGRAQGGSRGPTLTFVHTSNLDLCQVLIHSHYY